MADYYTQASFAFTCSIDEAALLEEAWQLSSDLSDHFDPDPLSEAFAAAFPARIEGDRNSGFLDLFDDPAFPQLGAEITVEGAGTDLRACAVHVYGLTDFQPYAIATLIRRCCQGSLASAPVAFAWAYSCSRPCLDGFAGGWCVVFADRICSGTSAEAIQAITHPAEHVAPDTMSVWDDDPDHPVADWQYEVANGDTRLGYHGWIAGRCHNDGQPTEGR